MEPPAVPPLRRRSRAWMAFFVLLVVLAGIGAVLPIVYNLSQQLRPAALEAARQRWREHGPKDYDLTFAITYDRAARPERHIVLVRGGKVVLAFCEGEICSLAPAVSTAIGLPAGGLGKEPGQDVPAIFDHLADLLRQQPQSRRNFLVAVFDPTDGHPRKFIYRLRGTSTREECNLKLWPAGTFSAGDNP